MESDQFFLLDQLADWFGVGLKAPEELAVGKALVQLGFADADVEDVSPTTPHVSFRPTPTGIAAWRQFRVKPGWITFTQATEVKKSWGSEEGRGDGEHREYDARHEKLKGVTPEDLLEIDGHLLIKEETVRRLAR